MTLTRTELLDDELRKLKAECLAMYFDLQTDVQSTKLDEYEATLDLLYRLVVERNITKNSFHSEPIPPTTPEPPMTAITSSIGIEVVDTDWATFIGAGGEYPVDEEEEDTTPAALGES